MALDYADLDPETRGHMLAELREDAARGRVYLSPRLTPFGQAAFMALFHTVIASGSDDDFAMALTMPGVLEKQERLPDGATKRVPYNAGVVLAEFMFNRYYVRGLCLRAIAERIPKLEVYRAKNVREPRATSIELIGTTIDARALLDDHRAHALDLETALGVPPGPGSGLSVRLPRGSPRPP